MRHINARTMFCKLFNKKKYEDLIYAAALKNSTGMAKNLRTFFDYIETDYLLLLTRLARLDLQKNTPDLISERYSPIISSFYELSRIRKRYNAFVRLYNELAEFMNEEIDRDKN